ncbi:MAG TPA: response regulator transcription factor [Woeseiaceae bacterium]|nr:response regulator transcription factor [Woeseiaceae bacterium]
MTRNQSSNPTVYVVDDDASIRRAIELLMRSVGQKCEIFSSGAEFLNEYRSGGVGCLVLDIRMPGMSGLEVQARLASVGDPMPIIFITGFADVPMAVAAMQKGAFDFIEKPFRDQELLDQIGAALLADDARCSQQYNQQRVAECLKSLTNRERQVMDLVVTGKPNKIIAHELDVSQRTVEIHRARVMEKMEARSLADLVRMSFSI